MKRVKEIKGETMNLRPEYFDYEYKGEYRWVQGELYYNKEKKRFEHEILNDKEEVEAIVYWPYEL